MKRKAETQTKIASAAANLAAVAGARFTRVERHRRSTDDLTDHDTVHRHARADEWGSIMALTDRSGARSVQAVVHAVQILRAFTPGQTTLGINEIARLVGLDKSSVSRLMHTLEGLGLVSREESGGPFRLGLEIVELAGVALAGLDLRRIARPHLISLSGTSGETTSVAVWDRGEAVMIEHVPGFEPLRSLGALGRRYPAHCTSPGKVLLAHRPQPEIDQILAGPLPAYTLRTVTDPMALRAELATIRSQGYAVNVGEWNRELAGVSARIRNHDGDVVAALGLAGPFFRFGRARMKQLIEPIVAAADAVSAEMGAPNLPL